MPALLDVLLLTLIAGIVWLEFRRTIHKAAPDLAGLLAALLIASAASPLLAAHAAFSPDPRSNTAWSFAVCFAAFCAASLGAARRLTATFTVRLGLFDAPLGALAGYGCALVVLHAVALTLHFAGVPLTGSPVCSEALDFTTYHSIVSAFTSLGSHERAARVG